MDSVELLLGVWKVSLLAHAHDKLTFGFAYGSKKQGTL